MPKYFAVWLQTWFLRGNTIGKNFYKNFFKVTQMWVKIVKVFSCVITLEMQMLWSAKILWVPATSVTCHMPHVMTSTPSVETLIYSFSVLRSLQHCLGSHSTTHSYCNRHLVSTLTSPHRSTTCRWKRCPAIINSSLSGASTSCHTGMRSRSPVPESRYTRDC